MAQEIKVVCHYDEIGLKGKNRPLFEKRLRRNIRFALKEIAPGLQVVPLRGRIVVDLGDVEWDEAEARLKRVFGIAYFASS